MPFDAACTAASHPSMDGGSGRSRIPLGIAAHTAAVMMHAAAVMMHASRLTFLVHSATRPATPPREAPLRRPSTRGAGRGERPPDSPGGARLLAQPPDSPGAAPASPARQGTGVTPGSSFDDVFNGTAPMQHHDAFT
eukprot:gene6531-12724_t